MIQRYPSRLWHFHAHAVISGGEAALVDPGVFPDELDRIAKDLEDRGAKVSFVFLTHSHHDHIRGWSRFPGARIVAPRAVAEKDETARARILAAKKAVDRKFEAIDPGFCYPEPDILLEEPTSMKVADTEILFRMNPGHSNCSSVLLVPSERALFSGDYLVSPGMPYCRWRIDRFEEALDRLSGWVGEFDVQTIYPAHNQPMHGRERIETAIAEEKEYFVRLRDAVRSLDDSIREEEELVRLVAQRIRPGKLWDQDRDNARRALREMKAGG